MASQSGVVRTKIVTDTHATVETGLMAFVKEFWNNIKNYAPNLIRWTLILSTTAFFGPKLFALAATKSYLFAGLGNWIAAHTPAFVYTIGAKLSFLTPAVNAISAGLTWSLNTLAYALETFSTLVMVAGQSVLGAGKFGAFTVGIAGLAVINAAVDTVLTLGGATLDTLTRRNTTSNIRPAHDAAAATFGRVDRLSTRAYNWMRAKFVPKEEIAAITVAVDADGSTTVDASATTTTPAADRRSASRGGAVVHLTSDTALPPSTLTSAHVSPANPGSAGLTGDHAHGAAADVHVEADGAAPTQDRRSRPSSVGGGVR